MTISLEDLANATGLALAGDGRLMVDRPSEPATAAEGDLALAMSSAYADALKASKARAAVVWDGADLADLGLEGALIAPRARVALASITNHFQHPTDIGEGIHQTAVIDPSAKIGGDVWIGPFVVIGERASVGDGARIGPHCTIGAEADIGANALLHPGVHVGARCTVGARFIAQPGAIVGADGFSFEPPQRGAVEAVRETGANTAEAVSGFLRIHSLAGVAIGDDVEIGAATTIDRGTIQPTRIGSGTKIDNQVQVAHNVQIGQTCLICAQVGIAGSVKIGDRVVLGGKVGIADQVTIGSDVVCAAGTMIASSVADRSVMMGVPGIPRDQAIKQIMAIRRLPRLLDQMNEIRKKLGL